MTGLKIMSNKVKDIENYLDSLFPNPKTELNYNKDYEFLIAVMLSAQTKDVRVNVVTEKLFSKYKTLKELSNANIEDVEGYVRCLGNYKNKSKAVIEIAKILDFKSVYRVKYLLSDAYLYSESDLIKYLSKLADIDVAIKSGSADGKILLELFIAKKDM